MRFPFPFFDNHSTLTWVVIQLWWYGSRTYSVTLLHAYTILLDQPYGLTFPSLIFLSTLPNVIRLDLLFLF